MSIEAETKIDVYEIDGKDAAINASKLVMRSHWNRNGSITQAFVVLVIGDKEYTVAASDLERAIHSCVDL